MLKNLYKVTMAFLILVCCCLNIYDVSVCSIENSIGSERFETEMDNRTIEQKMQKAEFVSWIIVTLKMYYDCSSN